MSQSPDAPRTTRLTGRAAVLAVVICAVVLSLAYPVRAYIDQRQQIDQLLSQQHTMQGQVKKLEAEKAKLSQSSYIEQLAREDLDMCFPGTKCYIVEGSDPLPGVGRAQQPEPSAWYAKLWRSVQQADANPAR